MNGKPTDPLNSASDAAPRDTPSPTDSLNRAPGPETDAEDDLPPPIPMGTRHQVAAFSVAQPVIPTSTFPVGEPLSESPLSTQANRLDPQETQRPAKPKTPAPTHLPQIPGYSLHEIIGRGGMGIVYRGTDDALGRTVAIKMIKLGTGSEETTQRFQQEAQNLAAIDHPGVARVFGFGLVSATPYLVMEYIDGPNLATKTAGQPVAHRQAAAWVQQLAQALDYCHRCGIVHRDIKPHNLLITSRDQIKLTDFGLARLIAGDTDARMTQTGEVIGTPAYMSPEQAGGVVRVLTAATDIYGAGAVLYELLTGRPPFISPDPLQTVLMVLKQQPVAPRTLQPRIPRDLENITLKCLQKNPKHRYASSAELADDLQRFLQGEPVRAQAVPTHRKVMHWLRSHPTITAVAVIGSLGIAATMWSITSYNFRLRRELDRTQRLVDQSRQLSEWLMYDFSRSLDQRPGITSLRAQLVDRIRDYLQKIQTDAAHDPKLQSTLTSSWLRLAELQALDGLGTLGQANAARESLAQVQSLLDRSSSARSPDWVALQTLVWLRQTDVERGLGNREAAIKRAQQARQLWDQDRTKVPAKEQLPIAAELLAVETNLALQNLDANALTSLLKQWNDLAEVLAADPTQVNLLLQVRVSQWKIRWKHRLESDSLESLCNQLQADIAAGQSLLDQARSPSAARDNLFVLQAILCDAWLELGELELALDLIEKRIRHWTEQLQLDPENAGIVFNLARAWLAQADSLLISGKLPEAKLAIEQAQPQFRRYAQISGDNRQTTLDVIDVDLTMIEWLQRSDQLDEAWEMSVRIVQQLEPLEHDPAEARQLRSDALVQRAMIAALRYSREMDFAEDEPPPSYFAAYETAVACLNEAIRSFSTLAKANGDSFGLSAQAARCQKMLDFVREQHARVLADIVR